VASECCNFSAVKSIKHRQETYASKVTFPSLNSCEGSHSGSFIPGLLNDTLSSTKVMSAPCETRL
jgi:hypothetical protein